MGDICDLSTFSYVSDRKPQQFRVQPNRNNDGRPPKQVVMFEEKDITKMQLICEDNPNKQFNYLINQEYTMLREK